MWDLHLRAVRAELRQLSGWFDDGTLRRMPSRRDTRIEGPGALLSGWRPEKPLIDRDTRVVAFGSCFAACFVEWLAEHGYNTAFDPGSDESLLRNQHETAVAVAQQFKWAFGELDAERLFWPGHDPQQLGTTEDDRRHVRERLVAAEVLIVSLSISEVWLHAPTGEVVWRVPPREQGDRYKMHVTTVVEATAALETIERLRAARAPQLKILYCVSPVRTHATFRKRAPLVADTASKARILASLDEFFVRHSEQVASTYFYFPAHEFVAEFFHDPFKDTMHLRDNHLRRLLEVFADAYVSDGIGGERLPFPGAAEDELLQTIWALEQHNEALQTAADERLALIEELDAEIGTLRQACDERLATIERLDGELRELAQADEQNGVAAPGSGGAVT